MVNPEIYTVSLEQWFHPFEIEKTKWSMLWHESNDLSERELPYSQPEIFFNLHLTDITPESREEEIISIGTVNSYGNVDFDDPTDFSPFKPQFGYRVDKQDFEEATRKRKLDRLQKEFERISRGESKRRSRSEKIVFHSGITCILTENGARDEWDRRSRLTGGLPKQVQCLDILRRLRCQIFAAGQAYEARGDMLNTFLNHFVGGAFVLFDTFYPFDTGPLTEVEIDPFGYSNIGQDLVLPVDSEKLASVEMKFHLGGVQR